MKRNIVIGVSALLFYVVSLYIANCRGEVDGRIQAAREFNLREADVYSNEEIRYVGRSLTPAEADDKYNLSVYSGSRHEDGSVFWYSKLNVGESWNKGNLYLCRDLRLYPVLMPNADGRNNGIFWSKEEAERAVQAARQYAKLLRAR